MNCECRINVPNWTRSNNTRMWMHGWPETSSTVTCNDCGLNVPHTNAMAKTMRQASKDDMTKVWAWRHKSKTIAPAMLAFAVWDALKATTRRDICRAVGVSLEHAELSSAGIPTEARLVLDLYSHPLPSWA